MSTPSLDVTDKTFTKEVMESDVPVLVDFWAPWCAPCSFLEPVLEALAEEYTGKYKFVRMNTDENSAFPTEYAIRSLPTLGFFRNGRMIDIIIGARPKTFIKSKLDENLMSIGIGQDEEAFPLSNEPF